MRITSPAATAFSSTPVRIAGSSGVMGQTSGSPPASSTNPDRMTELNSTRESGGWPGSQIRRRHQLRAGGDDNDPGLPPHQHPGDAGRQHGPLGPGGDFHPLGEHHFPGDQVLAHPADVVPGKHRGLHRQQVGLRVRDVFHHDHRVGARGHEVAGVDGMGILAPGEPPGALRTRPVGAGRSHGKTVHGRLVRRGGRPAGPHRRRGDPPPGRRGGHLFRRQHGLEVEPGQK